MFLKICTCKAHSEKVKSVRIKMGLSIRHLRISNQIGIANPHVKRSVGSQHIHFCVFICFASLHLFSVSGEVSAYMICVCLFSGFNSEIKKETTES